MTVAKKLIKNCIDEESGFLEAIFTDFRAWEISDYVSTLPNQLKASGELRDTLAKINDFVQTQKDENGFILRGVLNTALSNFNQLEVSKNKRSILVKVKL